MRSWVKASGSVPERRLSECVEEYLASRPDGGSDCRCVAFFADRFAGARGAQYCRELLKDARKLLELRLFDEESELWCHRSLLGRAFALRRADDAGLDERHLLRSEQALDVAEELGTGERGCVRLRGAAGSRFGLPMDGGDRCVRVVSYIDYNERSGSARVVDYRLAGFAAEKGGRCIVMRVINPYTFVPFGGGVQREPVNAGPGAAPLHSGYLDVKLIVRTPLIIPDGARYDVEMLPPDRNGRVMPTRPSDSTPCQTVRRRSRAARCAACWSTSRGIAPGCCMKRTCTASARSPPS